MKVTRQRLRPGSGHLICEMYSDGPTRVLKVTNISPILHQTMQNLYKSLNINASSDNNTNEKIIINEKNKSNEFYVNLPGGIGISLIMWLNQEYEELIYAYFKMFELNFDQTSKEQIIDLKIDSIQACNQLLNSQRKNLIYIQMPTITTLNEATNSTGKNQLPQSLSSIALPPLQPVSLPTSSSSTFSLQATTTTTLANLSPIPLKKLQPALSISILRQFNYENLILVKSFNVTLADVNLQIEEKLLWKLMQFMYLCINKKNSNPIETKRSEKSDEQQQQQQNSSLINAQNDVNNDYCNNKLTIQENFINLLNNTDIICTSMTNNYYKNIIDRVILNSKSTKYCLNSFQINTIKMNLSVYKTSKLSSDLIKIKSSLGIPLIQFENARIELNPFILINEYDTLSAIGNIVSKHYAQELKSHAMRILGSVDFLGNPLGLYADFMDSFSSVLSNGDVTELMLNLTHGVANSASKFTGSLSNELTELSMDEKHQETRETIRNNFNNGSIDHFIGGALGFAVGVVGGLTSVISQTYRGYSENGLSGAFVGLGKGAIGTVSKPVVGILDLANGVASAIRDTSKTMDKMEIPRIRETRCCSTPGTLLTPFTRSDAEGQKILYKINNFNLYEKYMSFEQLDDQNEPLIGIITNERVLFVTKHNNNDYHTIYQATYQELNGMRSVEENNRLYIELFLQNPYSGDTKSTRLKCKNRNVFNLFANKVRFAKANYDETKYAIVYDFDD